MTRLPIRFRVMTPNDLPYVTAIEQRSTPHPWQEAHFADSIKSGYQCVVAELDGQIIGHAVIMIAVDQADLLIITIDKPFQGRGAGNQLLEQVMEIASQKRCQTLLLEVRCSNSKAFNLYLNMGFSEIGIRKNYYPAGDTREDAIIMAMDLTAR